MACPGRSSTENVTSQVVRQPGDVPVVGADDDAVGFPQHLGQDDGERAVGRPEPPLAQLPGRRSGVLRSRHEQPTGRLGQRADECGDQLLAQSRHLPVESVRGDPIEDLGADVDGDSVSRRAGLELVGQRQVEVALVPGRREGVGADVACLVAHQQVLGEGEQVGSGAPGPLPPRVEVAGRDDLRREPMLVEVLQDVVADEDVATPGASLELRESLEQCAVVVEEPVVGRPVPLDEGMADEQLASQRSGSTGRTGWSVDDQRDAIEGDPLGRDRRSPARGPAGLGVLRLTTWAPASSAHSGSMAALTRAQSRVVSTSSAGHDDLSAACGTGPSPGEMRTGRPRAEVVALGLVAHADVESSPASSALWMVSHRARPCRGRDVGPSMRASCRPVAAVRVQVLPLADAQVVQVLALHIRRNALPTTPSAAP
jgi:hypothetical protein